MTAVKTVLCQHHQQDVGVERLVRQIGAYQSSISELRTGEAVYVRSHKHGRVPVGAYVRERTGS